MGVPVPDLLELSGLYDTGGAPILPPSYRSSVPLSVRDIVVFTARFRFAGWQGENPLPDSGVVTDGEEERPTINEVPGQIGWLLERVRATGVSVFGLVYGPNWDGSPKRFGKGKGTPARLNRIGRSLRAYSIFRNEFRTEVQAIQCLHLWENLPESTQSEIQLAWMRVNETRAKMSVEECVQVTMILPMTYLALGYVAEIRELLTSIGDQNQDPWREAFSLVDVEYLRDPLAYWEGLSARFSGKGVFNTKFDIQNAGTDLEKGMIPRTSIHVDVTPKRTKTQHAEILGYSSADTAFKKGNPLEVIWNNSLPNEKTKAKALPLSEIYPIVQAHRQRLANQQTGQRILVPQTFRDIQEMYEDPVKWE